MQGFESFPIFHGLASDEIARVLEGSETLAIAPNTTIFKKGETCDGFYIVLDGQVEIRRDQNGSGVRVALLGKPSVFGEMSLIVDRPRSAAAVATEAVRLTKVSKKRFDDLLAKGDLAAYKVIRALARIITERLKNTEEEFLATLKELGADKRDKKLAELQQFRQKLFTEWSF